MHPSPTHPSRPAPLAAAVALCLAVAAVDLLPAVVGTRSPGPRWGRLAVAIQPDEAPSPETEDADEERLSSSQLRHAPDVIPCSGRDRRGRSSTARSGPAGRKAYLLHCSLLF